MKIAVPTRDNKVDDHFGHCDHYTIYSIENKKIIAQETLQSPQGCGCKSDIASQLHQMGVEILLAGNMGEGAKNVLERNSIQVLRGCSGNTDDVVNAFLCGSLTDSGVGCASHEAHHGEHHQCHYENH